MSDETGLERLTALEIRFTIVRLEKGARRVRESAGMGKPGVEAREEETWSGYLDALTKKLTCIGLEASFDQASAKARANWQYMTRAEQDATEAGLADALSSYENSCG